jgi:8-oxo-dGTP diphosphatase
MLALDASIFFVAAEEDGRVKPDHDELGGAQMRLLLVAAVALIDTDGRVLISKRPEGKQLGGLWEFPGGKVEAGERPEVALIRELKEELAIDVAESCLAPLTFASHAYEEFHLLMPLYVCRRWKGQVRGAEVQELLWVKPLKLRDYPMPPADVPLIPHLIELL